MKDRLVLILCLTFCTTGLSDSHPLDSLETAVNNAEGTVRVDLLNELAYAWYSVEPAKTIIHAREALLLAEELGYEWGIADALNYLGMGYDVTGSYDEAMKQYLLSLKGFEKIEDEYGVSTLLNNIGTLYSQMGDHHQALEYYERSKKYFGEDDHESMAVYLNNIAEVYSMMGDNVKSLELYEDSRGHYEKMKDESGVATALNNMADVHKVMGNYEPAVKAALESKRIFEEIGEKSGEIYAQLTLSEISILMKDFAGAISSLKDAMALSESAGYGGLIQTTYENMYKAYRGLGDFEQAFEYYHLYGSLKDSLLSRESRNSIATMQILYETEKKEKEIEALKGIEQIRKVQINALIISSIAMLLAAVILFRSNRMKHKLNQKLDKQNRELSMLNKELDTALKKVKSLSGLLPICANCKKIRNDQGYWQQLEEYISDHSEADFSHGICPDCANYLYPGLTGRK